MTRILVAEDEASIRMPVLVNLELEGYQIAAAENGQQTIDLLKESSYDLLILDLMMPIKSGEDVLVEIRKSGNEIPVIIMSAKDSPEDRILGLKAGAIDYITKPFIIEELLIRVRNILQSQAPKTENTSYIIEGRTIDFKSLTISHPSMDMINVTAKEARLLELFVSQPDEVLSRDLIMSKVWNSHENPSSRTIDNFITQFRKYFEPDPKNPKYFMSIRGVGYMFSTKNDAQ